MLFDLTGGVQAEGSRREGFCGRQRRCRAALSVVGWKTLADVVLLQDFEAEKRREMERDAPKEEDNTLPGWVRLSSVSLLLANHLA